MSVRKPKFSSSLEVSAYYLGRAQVARAEALEKARNQTDPMLRGVYVTAAKAWHRNALNCLADFRRVES